MSQQEIELEEALAWLTPLTSDMHVTPDHIRAIKTLKEIAKLHLQAMKSGIPEKKDFPILYQCNEDDPALIETKISLRELKSLTAESYNQAIDDFTAYLAQKEEGIERIIAEFIPHKDELYIKPLAEAICKHLGVEK